MALINTATDKVIVHPTDKYSRIEAHAVWLVPFQYKKLETIVQVVFFRPIEEGEISDERLIGYVPILEGGLFNIGNAPTHMGLTTFEQDLHDFAIEKLGSGFVKSE